MQLIGHELIDPSFPRSGGGFLVGVPLMESSLRGKNGDASCGVSSTGQAEHSCFVVIRVLNFSNQGSEIEKGEVYGDS